MKKGIFTLLLFSYASICFGGAADFTGTYRCKGIDPYLNESYSGIVKIAQQNAVYKLDMAYDTGEKAIGTAGLYDDTTIAVVFQDKKNLKKVGLERYSLTPDHKKIQGYWVYLGEDKLGKEVCVKE